jgi:uncharacterized protein YjiS (DUF1127 family)
MMATRIQLDFSAMSTQAFHDARRGVSRDGVLAWFHAAAKRWRERRVLETLDDRMLHDIGISRSQALAEARKSCWRR